MDISSLTEMTVEQLKNALKERGLLTTGLKEELVQRLEAFLGSENKQVKHTMQHVGKLWQEVYVNKLRRYRGFFKPKWLLMPHPKLRNQSPIRAIQSDEGRALLDQLLKGVGPSVAAKTLRRFWLRRSEIPFLAAHVSSFSRHSLSPPLLVVPYRICTIPITHMLLEILCMHLVTPSSAYLSETLKHGTKFFNLVLGVRVYCRHACEEESSRFTCWKFPVFFPSSKGVSYNAGKMF